MRSVSIKSVLSLAFAFGLAGFAAAEQLDHWVYESSKITDGEWTFSASVTKNTTNLTVGAPVEAECPTAITPLDFSKPVEKAGDPSVSYTITELNCGFSYYSGGLKTRDCAKYVGELTLPGEGLVKFSSAYCFLNCVNATGDIVFPSSLTSLPKNALGNTKISSAYFKATTLTVDGGYDTGTFQGCTQLTNVVFEAGGSFSLTSGYNFKGCSLLETADLSGVASISLTANRDQSSYAHFQNCSSLKKVVFRGGVAFNAVNIFGSGNTSLRTIEFTGAPPTSLMKPYLANISSSQVVTTTVPGDQVESWKPYAANGTIDTENSTWAAEYVASGVSLENRLLLKFVDPSLKPPAIISVEVGDTTANSIEIVVDGENLNNGTVTITLDDGMSPVISSGELTEFGSYVFTELPSGANYEVGVSAVNESGAAAFEPFVTGTYGTTTLAARMYYSNRSRTATFVYDDVDRSHSAGVQQFELGDTGGTRDWLKGDNSLISGFNPLTAVFDASFKSFKAQDLSYLFNNWKAMSVIEGIENLDTSECTTMGNMFYHVDAMTELDLSYFKTGKVTGMGGMFQWSAKLKTVYANDNFSTLLVSSTANLFNGASAIKGAAGTVYSADHQLVDYARVDDPDHGKPGYFTFKAPPAAKAEIASVIVDPLSVNLSNATVKVSGSDLQGGTVTVRLLVDGVEKRSAQSESFGEFAFEGLDDDTTYQVVVTAENDAGTTTDDSVAFTTWSVTELGARAVYFAATRTMTFFYDMIDRSSSATWAVDFGANGARTWGVPNGKSDWFQDDSIATVVLDPSFATYRPKTCAHWFSRLKNSNDGVKIEGIQYLDTSEVTSMYRMFYNFKTVEIVDISGFKTKKVTSMEQMFGYGGWSKMDLSSFDTRNVTSMGEMFVGSGAATIYANEKFVTTAVTSSANMFNNCKQLVGEKGTVAYNAGNPVNKEYARVDDPDNGKPGYFTYKAPPHQGLMLLVR